MLENRHHNIILDFNDGGGDERWKVYPLLSSESESESEFNYQRIREYVNSCNGLLFFFDENDGKAYICNPTSNECRVIPSPPIVDSPLSIWGNSSLGFDSRSNDYKFLISVSCVSGDSVSNFIFLYSLKTNSWKSLADFPSAVALSNPCVYADGSIYWVSPAFTSDCAVDSFDLADETFSSFDISHLFRADTYQVKLADRGGSQLGLVAYQINSPYRFELWVKTAGAGAGWNINKLWDFSLPQILDLRHRYPRLGVVILGFCGEILYLAAANGQVFAYDCAANHLEKLHIRLRKYRDPVFISYVETTHVNNISTIQDLDLDLSLSLRTRLIL